MAIVIGSRAFALVKVFFDTIGAFCMMLKKKRHTVLMKYEMQNEEA